MYGCFHEDTNIYFADGTLHSIREVVENKLIGPVLSYNEEKGIFEQANIINWFNNGKLEQNQKWYSFKTNTHGSVNGVNGFSCTGNHMILTKDGYVAAEDIKMDMKLVSWYTSSIKYNSIYYDIIHGSLLGDGGIHVRKVGTGSFILTNDQQPEYLNWKLKLLKDLNFSLIKNSWRSQYSVELQKLYDKFYQFNPNRNKLCRVIIDEPLTALSAAVWFLDDGSIHHGAGKIARRRILEDNEFNNNQKFIGRKIIAEFIGCDIENIKYQSGCFTIPAEQFRIFCDKIKHYVVPSMQYKLREEYRNQYKEFDSDSLVPHIEKQYVDIISIDTSSKRKMRAKTKYDIEVENNHCYLVGGDKGIVVHNSPTVTPGGSAK